MSHTISDTDLANLQTQTGYAKSALLNMESHNPVRQIDVKAVHDHANAVALISAFAIKDTNGDPLASDYFGGSGSVTSTTPQSGGISGK